MDAMLARYRVLRFEQNQVHGGTTPHRRCYGLDTPGYVPLAGSSHLSPGAIVCRYSVAVAYFGKLLPRDQLSRVQDSVAEGRFAGSAYWATGGAIE